LLSDHPDFLRIEKEFAVNCELFLINFVTDLSSDKIVVADF